MHEKELAHLSGEGVIVKTWYANCDTPNTANVYTSLPDDAELSLWEDSAFTTGGQLVKIELIWDLAEAENLKAAKTVVKVSVEDVHVIEDAATILEASPVAAEQID